MDPYLEDPAVWPGVHHLLISQIANSLQPLVEPNYVASVGTRVYVGGGRVQREFGPDVGVFRSRGPSRDTGTALADPVAADEPVVLQSLASELEEGFVELRSLALGSAVVAVIEVVSPTNKFAGRGRRLYRRKQRQVLASQAHLVEIDLLRKGPYVLAVSEHEVRGRYEFDYLVSVNRARGEDELRGEHEVYPRKLRERLPVFRLPLAGSDPDVRVDLQDALAAVYRDGRFHRLIRYDRPCVPALAADDQAWADGLIRAAAPATSRSNG